MLKKHEDEERRKLLEAYKNKQGDSHFSKSRSDLLNNQENTKE